MMRVIQRRLEGGWPEQVADVPDLGAGHAGLIGSGEVRPLSPDAVLDVVVVTHSVPLGVPMPMPTITCSWTLLPPIRLEADVDGAGHPFTERTSIASAGAGNQGISVGFRDRGGRELWWSPDVGVSIVPSSLQPVSQRAMKKRMIAEQREVRRARGITPQLYEAKASLPRLQAITALHGVRRCTRAGRNCAAHGHQQ